MPKKPYPSQIAPEPKPMPKRVGQQMPKPKTMPKRIGDGSKIPKPYKGPRVENGGPSSSGKKPTPSARRQPPAKQVAMGIMGSTEVQAKARQQKALDDMRKRGMLRKKQG